MATQLINGNFSRISDVLENVLGSMHSEGQDSFKDGIWRIGSRLKYNGNDTHIFKLDSSSLKYAGTNTGKITMITNTDAVVSENLRVNPLCNFSTGSFNAEGLVGWCGHSKAVKADDDKAGRVYITTEENESVDSLGNIKTIVFDAGKAIGTCKNLVETVDVREDITSGFSAYQEYALETNSTGVPTALYGFHAGINGLTGEYEIIISNDSKHCQAIKNIKTGKLTYIDSSDARYNLVPSNFTGAVSLGDYIYYIGINGKIYKINKYTFAVEASVANIAENCDITNQYKSGLFTNGSELFISFASSYNESLYRKVDQNSFNLGGYNYMSSMNIPAYLNTNNNVGIMIRSIGDSKYVLYNTSKCIAVVFTDLNDVAGSILPEYTQFNVGGDSFNLTSEGMYSYWINSSVYNDLEYPADYSLKVCKNTSGQVFASAEWDGGYENTGSKQLTLNIYDTLGEVSNSSGAGNGGVTF